MTPRTWNAPPSDPDPEEQVAVSDRQSGTAAGLGVWDAGSLIVGIVIGATIFKSPSYIASQTSSAGQLVALWLLGGGLALVGAFCYAELGAAYGGAGGDYQYLTRAFGRWAGFLFGWSQFVVVQTVNIAMFAHVFAEFAWKLIGPASPVSVSLTAAGTVIALTLVNLLGLKSGRWTQNFLTTAKLTGVLLLILAGFAAPRSAAISEPVTGGNWTTALILILYAYGGWNDAAYVVAEVRDRQRNMPRALLCGVGLITALYLAVNGAYLQQLGFAGLQQSGNPPVAVMTAWWGDAGARAMTVIVMLSALGAVNGLILSVSRLNAAVGSDHRLFSLLGRWSTRHDVPVGSLIVQAMFTVLLLVLVGTPTGRVLLDRLFQIATGQPLPWDGYGGDFSLLFAVGAPVFWTFFLATGLAFLVLRWREPDRERPFRAPGYPLTPLLFCAMCGFGLYASVKFAGVFTWLGVVPVAVGGAVYLLEQQFVRTGAPAAKGTGDDSPPRGP